MPQYFIPYRGAAEARVSHLLITVVLFGLLLLLFLLLLPVLLFLLPFLLILFIFLLLFPRKEVINPGQVVLGENHVQHLSDDHQTQDLFGLAQNYERRPRINSHLHSYHIIRLRLNVI